jgi:clan AA aspartic protease
MIEGRIRESGTPVVTLQVMGTGGRTATVEGILDTGFDGFLCLPIPIAVTLGLELTDVSSAELADGTVIEDELVFAGQAEWDGTMMRVLIVLTRSEDALIGTAFLQGYVVQLDYKANTVRIEKAP